MHRSELDRLPRRQRAALRRLLVAATAAGGRPDLREQLVAALPAAPLEALPAAAALHRVSGCVHEALIDLPGIPAAVIGELASARRRAAAKHVVISQAAVEIGRVWDAAGIPWAAFKGPAATVLLYPDGGWRRYGDLDVLVARQALGRASELLEELGYGHLIKDWQLAEGAMAGEILLQSPSVDVDLHWDLFYSSLDRRSFAIDVDAMLERVRTVRIGGSTIRTLDAVDTLLVLAIHATRSGAHRLMWMKDIERAVRVERPDLDELVHRARAARCAPVVGLAMFRAEQRLSVGIPADAIEALLGPSFRFAERLTTAVSDPVRLDERDTLARVFARSIRSSWATSVGEIGPRSVRWVSRKLRPPVYLNLDDPLERSAFFEAVANTGARQ